MKSYSVFDYLNQRDFIEIIATPYAEPCTSAGGDLSQMYMEGNTLKAQLQRQFGLPPEGFNFCLTARGLKEGIAISFRLEFDSEPPSLAYALKLEKSWPAYWDQTSIDELKQQGYLLLSEINGPSLPSKQ